MAAKKPVKKATKKTKKTAKSKPAVKKTVKKAPIKAAKKTAKKTAAKRLTKKETKVFKMALLELRAKILGSLQNIEGGALSLSQRDSSGDLSGYSFHMADMATDNFDREFNLGLAANEQDLLNQIDAALRKIDEGTFGICEMTQEPISRKRLKAMPYARYSIKAQEELEEKKRRLD